MPTIRSPSQRPGGARSSSSGGRSEIETSRGMRPRPLAPGGACAWNDRCSASASGRCASGPRTGPRATGSWSRGRSPSADRPGARASLRPRSAGARSGTPGIASTPRRSLGSQASLERSGRGAAGQPRSSAPGCSMAAAARHPAELAADGRGRPTDPPRDRPKPIAGGDPGADLPALDKQQPTYPSPQTTPSSQRQQQPRRVDRPKPPIHIAGERAHVPGRDYEARVAGVRARSSSRRQAATNAKSPAS